MAAVTGLLTARPCCIAFAVTVWVAGCNGSATLPLDEGIVSHHRRRGKTTTTSAVFIVRATLNPSRKTLTKRPPLAVLHDNAPLLGVVNDVVIARDVGVAHVGKQLMTLHAEGVIASRGHGGARFWNSFHRGKTMRRMLPRRSHLGHLHPTNRSSITPDWWLWCVRRNVRRSNVLSHCAVAPAIAACGRWVVGRGQRHELDDHRGPAFAHIAAAQLP